MSRCVIIPFSEEVTDLTTKQIMELSDAEEKLASCLPNLLHFSKADRDTIALTVDNIQPQLMSALKRYEPPESTSHATSRICHNIAMLYAFATQACFLKVEFLSAKHTNVNNVNKCHLL